MLIMNEPTGEKGLDSPDRYLLDSLYNLDQVHRKFQAENEPAVGLMFVLEDCLVFIDQNSGNRINLSSLPLDDEEFAGASLVIDAASGTTIRYTTLDGNEIESDRLEFDIYNSAVNPPFLLDEKTGKWHEVDPAELAEFIDMPKIKPIPISESDPRVAPPIVEGEMPALRTPRTLYQYYTSRAENDLLLLPKYSLYTELSRQFDMHSRNGYVDSNIMVREGTVPLDQLERAKDGREEIKYRLEVSESEEEGSKEKRFFDREYFITFTSQSGPISFPARRTLTSDPYEYKSIEVNFWLRRGDLEMFIWEGDEEIALVPYLETTVGLYNAVVNSSDIY